jgi:hypothetical protein
MALLLAQGEGNGLHTGLHEDRACHPACGPRSRGLSLCLCLCPEDPP